MTDQVTAFTNGAGLTTLVTLALGPILGEYAIIFAMGTLGSLMALSESSQPSLWRSLLFLVKGVVFSFVFTSLITVLLMRYVVPDGAGITPYALLSVVSFSVGWSTDRIGVLKEAFLSRVVSLVSSSKTDVESPSENDKT